MCVLFDNIINIRLVNLQSVTHIVNKNVLQFRSFQNGTVANLRPHNLYYVPQMVFFSQNLHRMILILIFYPQCDNNRRQPNAEIIKSMSMLNSTGHGISLAHKWLNAKN